MSYYTSKQNAQNLYAHLPNKEKEVFDDLMDYFDSDFLDAEGEQYRDKCINEMLKLSPDQRDKYLFLFTNTPVPQEFLSRLSQELSIEKIQKIEQILIFAQEGEKKAWEILMMSDDTKVFVSYDDLRKGVSNNPSLVEYMTSIELYKHDQKYHQRNRDVIFEKAKDSAERQGIDFAAIIQTETKKTPTLRQSLFDMAKAGNSFAADILEDYYGFDIGSVGFEDVEEKKNMGILEKDDKNTEKINKTPKENDDFCR